MPTKPNTQAPQAPLSPIEEELQPGPVKEVWTERETRLGVGKLKQVYKQFKDAFSLTSPVVNSAKESLHWMQREYVEQLVSCGEKPLWARDWDISMPPLLGKPCKEVPLLVCITLSDQMGMTLERFQKNSMECMAECKIATWRLAQGELWHMGVHEADTWVWERIKKGIKCLEQMTAQCVEIGKSAEILELNASLAKVKWHTGERSEGFRCKPNSGDFEVDLTQVTWRLSKVSDEVCGIPSGFY